MPGSTTQPPIESLTGPLPAVQIDHWPLRDERRTAWGMVAGMVAISIGVAWLSGVWWTAPLCAAALAVAMWRVWVPITYRINGHGITQTALGRSWLRPWRSFQRFRQYRFGLILFPDSDPAPLAVWHGLYLPCQDRLGEIVAIAEQHLGIEIEM